MKHIADIHFGHLTQPKGWRVPEIRPAMVECMQPGTVIFIDSVDVGIFIDQYHDKIRVPYIIMSGDSDEPIPGKFLSHVERALKSSLLLHWYAMNCERGRAVMGPKWTCLPNGVSQWTDFSLFATYMGAGVGLLNGTRHNYAAPKRTERPVLATFNAPPHHVIRVQLAATLCRAGGLGHCAKEMNFPKYFRALQASKFVASPRGKGEDCYRTYEALYMSSYPIVKRSALAELFAGLPVLVLDEWAQINTTDLERVFRDFRAREFNYAKLYTGFWQKEIYAHRPQAHKNYRYRYSTALEFRGLRRESFSPAREGVAGQARSQRGGFKRLAGFRGED